MRQNDRHLRKPRVSALLHAHHTTPLYRHRPVPARGGLASVLSNGRTTCAATGGC